MKKLIFTLFIGISMIPVFSQINIVHQPWPASACEGGNLGMDVIVSPNAGVSYEWEIKHKNYFNWTTISPATILYLKKIPGFENIDIPSYNTEYIYINNVGYQMDSLQLRCKITQASPPDVEYTIEPYARVYVTPGLDLSKSVLFGCDSSDIKIQIDSKYNPKVLTKCYYQMMPNYLYINDTNPTTIMNNFPISVNQSGKYLFTAFNREYSGCSSSDTVNVNVHQVYQSEQIGMVTLDPPTNKWAVLWRRTTGAGTKSCRILQDDGKGGNKLIGEVTYASNVGYFVDKYSSASIPPLPYKIELTDSCGHISVLSVAHQPIYMNNPVDSMAGTMLNLKWTPYQGFAYPFFYIHHGPTRASLFQITSIFDSVPSTKSNYTINNPVKNTFYAISVRLPSPLVLVTQFKAESGPYTQSLSNITEYKGPVTMSTDYNLPADLYPNPFSNELSVEYTLDKNSDVLIEIINSLGEKIGEALLKNQTTGSHTEKIDPSSYGFSEGVNVIKITSDNKTSSLRCVYIRK